MSQSQLVGDLIIAGVSGIAAAFAGWLFGGRKRLKVDQFTAYTTAQDALIARQTERIDTLETRVEERETALENERGEHARTRSLLADAVEQIGQMKAAVRRYFQQVADAWAPGSTMPRPDPLDLHWLAQPVQKDTPPTE